MKVMTEPEVVTSVEPDSRGAGALRVQVDGRSFCTIPAALGPELGLRPGLPVTGELRQRLSRAADAQAAYRSVLAALGRRGFACRDLERRLVLRGHPREAARAAIDRATAAGLLDDRQFAAAYVQVKSARGRGPARLQRDLFTMGVDRAIADEAIAAAWAEPDRVADATLALALKRATQLGTLPGPTKRRRLLAYLARRGFTGREVRALVSRVLSAEAKGLSLPLKTAARSNAMR
jgi:regulatory protein